MNCLVSSNIVLKFYMGQMGLTDHKPYNMNRTQTVQIHATILSETKELSS